MSAILNPTIEQINFTMTNHAIVRASQRGIKKSIIEQLLQYGEVIKKQGLRYYFMTQNTLKFLDLKLQDQLRNVVVILTADDYILTCYKNENALKSIKQKSKRLSKPNRRKARKKAYLN
jgi:hypothetical protein